jgi:CRISPR/Cas system-associated endonuclease/helicase Cas3
MPLPTLLRKGALLPAMGEKKQDLDKYIAIDYIMEWFKNKIDNLDNAKDVNDRIVILESATGSGKSTAFVAYLYFLFNKQLKGNIIVTEPRVATTISIPNSIASEPSYQKENRND